MLNKKQMNEVKQNLGLQTLSLNEYQRLAATTADYPNEYKKLYPLLGVIGEAGEYAEKILTSICMLLNGSQIQEKIKKILRDHEGNFDQDTTLLIIKELGDQLWYISKAAGDLGYSLNEVANINLDKLFDRKGRNMIHGAGDER